MNYKTIPPREIVEKTATALKERNVEALVVDTKEQALEEKLGF